MENVRYQHFVATEDVAHVLEQAKEELKYEKFREAVEKKKLELLTKKPLWAKLFPFKITVQRI